MKRNAGFINHWPGLETKITKINWDEKLPQIKKIMTVFIYLAIRLVSRSTAFWCINGKLALNNTDSIMTALFCKWNNTKPSQIKLNAKTTNGVSTKVTNKWAEKSCYYTHHWNIRSRFTWSHTLGTRSIYYWVHYYLPVFFLLKPWYFQGFFFPVA